MRQNPTACQQDVFALLVPSSYDKPGTSCYHLVTRLMIQQSCYKIVSTS